MKKTLFVTLLLVSAVSLFAYAEEPGCGGQVTVIPQTTDGLIKYFKTQGMTDFQILEAPMTAVDAIPSCVPAPCTSGTCGLSSAAACLSAFPAGHSDLGITKCRVSGSHVLVCLGGETVHESWNTCKCTPPLQCSISIGRVYTCQ